MHKLIFSVSTIQKYMVEKPTHILISQLKNVGDVVLALPVAGLIRVNFPQATITFLATTYTHPIIAACPDVDHFLDGDKLLSLSDQEATQQLKALNITAILHLCDNDRLAKLSKKAGISYRIGTIQHLPNWIYCNRWVNQARRHSHLHEVESNVHMLKPLGISSEQIGSSIADLIPYLHLEPKTPLPSNIEGLLSPDRFNLIIHPGSHGHGREWPSRYFQQLIEALPAEKFKIFITGSPGEQERFASLIQQSPDAINMMGTMTLEELLTFIQRADGLIASGTGPLHIAAALGIKTLGLFPPRQGISPRRWQPVGKQATALVYERPVFKCCFSCRGKSECFCMTQISIKQVLDVIKNWVNN